MAGSKGGCNTSAGSEEVIRRVGGRSLGRFWGKGGLEEVTVVVERAK